MKSLYFSRQHDFITYLNSKCQTEKYVNGILRSCRKIFSHRINTAKELIVFYNQYSESKKYLYLAIRNLLSFWDENDLLPREDLDLIRAKIKRKCRYQADSYVPNTTEITQLLEKTKEDLSFHIFIRIMLDSGLRSTNAFQFVRTFEQRKAEVVGDIVCYPLFNILGTKGSFYVFLKKETYELFIANLDLFEYFNLECVKSFLRFNKLISVKYLRKYHFTQLIRSGVSFETANFIQGRTTKDIGFNHYLAKKEIALKEYTKLLLFS
jgi:intergrase/recombinase